MWVFRPDPPTSPKKKFVHNLQGALYQIQPAAVRFEIAPPSPPRAICILRRGSKKDTLGPRRGAQSLTELTKLVTHLPIHGGFHVHTHEGGALAPPLLQLLSLQLR